MSAVEPPLRVSVVVCAWTEDRWAALGEALRSLREQDPPPHELLVVIDHNDALLERVRSAHPDAVVLANEEARGLSGARNTGVRAATGDVIAFLDDDARARPGWTSALLGAFAAPEVVGVGGRVHPRWEDRVPAWLPGEFLWTVGCSFTGQPGEGQEIRNPIGANMAFRRAAFEAAGGFAAELGWAAGGRLVGCEETEFAIRVRQAMPGARILQAPGMEADHLVPRDRTTWRYFRRRCSSEGVAKALVGRRVGSQDGLASERAYTAVALPRGVARGLRDGVTGDRAGFRRAGAIVAGFSITAASYGQGLVQARTSDR